MSEQAQAGASATPSAPQKPKGNQLEGAKSKALSTQDAADIFRGTMLGENVDKDENSSDKGKPAVKKDDKPNQAKKPQGQSAPEEEDETDPADDTDDADPTGSDEGQADGDDQADDGADDADDADDADGQDLHTVIVDGEEVQIPYEELVAGYQRQADYTKKTTELAQERKALQSEKEQIADLPKVKEAYQKEAGRFSENAGLVLVALEKGFMPQPPDEKLRTENPAEYLAQKEKHQEAIQFMRGLLGEQQKIATQQKAEHQQAVNDGRTKLMQVHPELQKPENRGQLQTYILGLGYTQDEIKETADHRLFGLAFKAMKWDDLMKRAQNPDPTKVRPKVLSQTHARDDKSTVSQKKRNETVNRHKREHSVKSASDVIAQRIIASRKKN